MGRADDGEHEGTPSALLARRMIAAALLAMLAAAALPRLAGLLGGAQRGALDIELGTIRAAQPACCGVRAAVSPELLRSPAASARLLGGIAPAPKGTALAARPSPI